MKYTVTIKDNESGEIVKECECNSLIAGASINNEESASIVISHCKGEELLGACKSAKIAIYKAIENNFALETLFTLFEMKLNLERREELKEKMQEKEDTDND